MYELPGCDEDEIAGSAVVDLTPKCLPLGDTMVGLGSKIAMVPFYEPGWCEPLGGEVTGPLELKGAATFCCQ